jgi:hypothetical protein
MIETIVQFLFGSGDATLAFFGPFLSLVGTLAGLAGGGQDNSANVAASVQNQKLRSATERANQESENARVAGQEQVRTGQASQQMQQQALNNIVSNFRNVFLRNLQR